MSDDQRTEAGTGGDDDVSVAPDTGAAGGAGGTTAPGGGKGGGGTYPAEQLDLGGGTSDGDTPSTDGGG